MRAKAVLNFATFCRQLRRRYHIGNNNTITIGNSTNTINIGNNNNTINIGNNTNTITTTDDPECLTVSRYLGSRLLHISKELRTGLDLGMGSGG
jgi:hypothetical protein